jgi:Cu-processing system permease protein
MAGPLFAFASQELVLAVRSRWTQIFAAVFGLLAFAVAASGYILSGGHGVQDFARTSVSLVQLVILLVPLTALLIGVMALSAEPGASELVYSQPIARTTILLGKLLGQFLALGAAQALGFGAAGLAISWQAGDEGVGRFLLLAAGSLALTAIFLGIAAVVAAGSPGRRARAIAVALAVWFGAVVLFDVVALTAASFLRSGTASRLLIVSVVVNPVDAVRTGTLLGIEGVTAFGAASLAFLRFTHGAAGAALAVCGSVLFWLIVPLIVAARRLERADL